MRQGGKDLVGRRRKEGIDLQEILDEYHVACVMVKQGHVKPNA